MNTPDTLVIPKPTPIKTATATVPQPDWRRHAGHVAWPTIALATSVLTVYAAVTWAGATGHIPLWAAAVANTVLAYLAFTPLHDASHGAVAGGHKRFLWLETVIGWLSGFVLIAPFPAFRALHLRHHGHTNDPEKDPDYWVAANTPLVVAAKCLTILPHYVACFLFNPSRSTDKHKRLTIPVLVTWLLIPALAAPFGHALTALVLYTLPAWLALGLLAFLFDYLPHRPHNARGRFVDTRVILLKGFGALTMNQSYHSVHHLWPRIPFYRYSTFFWEAKDYLASQGTPVTDLRRRS